MGQTEWLRTWRLFPASSEDKIESLAMVSAVHELQLAADDRRTCALRSQWPNPAREEGGFDDPFLSLSLKGIAVSNYEGWCHLWRPCR